MDSQGVVIKLLRIKGKIKNPLMHTNISGSDFGGDEEDRTPDLCIANAALSQLSYTPEIL